MRIQREDVKFEIACYPNKVQEWRDGMCVAMSCPAALAHCQAGTQSRCQAGPELSPSHTGSLCTAFTGELCS